MPSSPPPESQMSSPSASINELRSQPQCLSLVLVGGLKCRDPIRLNFSYIEQPEQAVEHGAEQTLSCKLAWPVGTHLKTILPNLFSKIDSIRNIGKRE